MKRFAAGLIFMALLVSLPGLSLALEVSEGVITTNVVDREPVDQIQTYAAATGKLYCFTRVLGAADETSITHVWKKGDLEMARLTLPVRSSNWRTWSSKNIMPEWTGAWQVDVIDADGNLLKSIPFTLN